MSGLFEWNIDFVGQKHAEYTYQSTIVLFAFIGFAVGFLLQSLKTTLQIYGTGMILAALLVLPPWPFYNKHPVQWLAAKPAEVDEIESENNGDIKTE